MNIDHVTSFNITSFLMIFILWFMNHIDKHTEVDGYMRYLLSVFGK